MGRLKRKGFPPLRSGLERKIHDQLKAEGVKFEYEPHNIEYRQRVVRGICGKCGEQARVYQRKRYLPDFLLENGIYIEVKGRLTSKDRSKMLSVIEQNPDKDFRMVFGANNKLNKNKEERYMQWAAKNKIKAAVLEIPKSWLK